MSKEEHSPIKLQLEEAIWLDHRAENAEIISLELIPDVDIVDNDDMVNIRGHLVLIGRFDTDEYGNSLDLESSSLADQLHFDPLQVEPKELYEQAYRGKIEHRFPFDVTIPANKISHVEDVYVQVEQFDYTIAEGHRLQIKTEISITGIKQEVQQKAHPETEEQTKPEPKVWSDFLPVRNKEREETHEQVKEEQQRKQSEELADKTEDTQEVSSRLEADDVNREEAKHVKVDKEENNKAEIKQEERSQKLQSEEPSLEEQTQSEKSEQVEAASETVMASEEWEGVSNEEETVQALFPQEIKTTFSSRPDPEAHDRRELNSESANGIEDEELREEQPNRTVNFLTKLMEEGKEESNQKRRVRMCIIQQNESLEDIAERYSISVYELMRANQLETDQITKGQILYIPSP